MSVSVVTVTYSPGKSLVDFLDSLATATSQPVRVIMADNGSTDGSPQREQHRPGVELVSTGGNVGYGAAANLGVQHTDTDWVLVANPDVVFSPGSLDALMEVAARWPRAGSVGPLIRTAQGDVYPSARALPTLGAGIGHAVFGWWLPNNRWSAAYRQDHLEPAERVTGWLSGSCLLIRRDAFDSVGGFDPGYFMYFEDVDFGGRLGRAGWLNVYAPEAEVTHIGAHATAQHPARMAAEHHRSAMRYLEGRYPGRRWLVLRVALRVGLRLRGLLASKTGAITGGAHYQRTREDHLG